MREKVNKNSIRILIGDIFAWSHAQVTPTIYNQVDKTSMNRWVDSVYNTLSLDQRWNNCSCPSWNPKQLEKQDRHPRATTKCGWTLFSKGTLAQQAEITNYAQELAEVPLLISVDGEWGLSMRLSDAPVFPGTLSGAIQDPEIVRQYGREMARQCREMGIHVNFAPTMDVHSNPDNPVIGTRSYGENPSRVAIQGVNYAKGLEENGVMAVAKHFPGHGDTSEDSHLTLPTIRHGRARLDSVELYPFKEYINAGLSGMMIGHLNIPALQTNGLPASLSPKIGVDLLKKEMGFSGLTFSDGMAMKGVSSHPDASVRALLAGNDIILGSVNQKKEIDLVKKAVEEGTISASLLEEKVRNILAYKYILKAHQFTPINTGTIHRTINSPAAEWMQRKIYDGAVTLIKNEGDLLPIKDWITLIASVAVGARHQPQETEKYAGITTEWSLRGNHGIVAETYDRVILSIHSHER